MIYIHVDTLKYPVTSQEIRDTHPNTSFPVSFDGLDLSDFGFAQVMPMPQPSFNPLAETVVEQAPGNSGGLYYQSWAVVPLSAEQCVSNAQRIVQQHLDAKARERNYDGILSACSYATSGNQKFSAEGQACIAWRDAVWAACYQIMAAVQVGAHAMPTPESLISELPGMVWPS